MTVLDFRVIVTEPGAGDSHPFAPPAGFEGASEDYLQLMRRRFKDDYHPHGQRMTVAARDAARSTPTFTGPFAAEARRIIDSLKPRRLERSVA